MENKIVAIYQYFNLNNSVAHETIRYSPKDFRQRQPGPDGYIWSLQGIEPILYRLPEITEAIKEGRPVFVCEGEKDADNLVKLGFEATTCPMGAGKWRRSYTEALKDALVLICPDKDQAGWKHALTVADEIYFITECVKILILPGPGKDVSDWIEAGGTAEQIEELADEAPIHMPLDYRREYDARLRTMKPEQLIEELEWLKTAPMRNHPKLSLIEYQIRFWQQVLAYEIPKKGGTDVTYATARI